MEHQHGKEFIEPIDLLPPKSDIVFKMIFGDKRNINILKAFLKAILDLNDSEYQQITLIDPQGKRENKDDKLSIVDVELITRTGKIVHIEIQIAEQIYLPERIVYYNSKIVAQQLEKGGKFENLVKTITIAIADFEIVRDSDRYYHKFQLYEQESGLKFSDLVEINTLELKKIPPESDNTEKYEWVKFLKAEQKEEFEMLSEQNPNIREAYNEVIRISQNLEARALYEAREKELKDFNSRISDSFTRGEQSKAIRVAENLFKMGLSIEQIVRGTDLSIEEVQQIKANLKV